MTREEILALAPGPELDYIIRKTLMGYMANFSTDIKAAIELLEYMRQTVKMDGCRACIEIHGTSFDEGQCNDQTGGPYLVTIGGVDAWAKTIPEAICKAVLLYKNHKREMWSCR